MTSKNSCTVTVCLEISEIPDRITTDRTVLIMKYEMKKNYVTNFKSINFLPLKWKIFTGIRGYEPYSHPDSKRLLSEKQRGYQIKLRRTKNQLIDKTLQEKAWEQHE